MQLGVLGLQSVALVSLLLITRTPTTQAADWHKWRKTSPGWSGFPIFQEQPKCNFFFFFFGEIFEFLRFRVGQTEISSGGSDLQFPTSDSSYLLILDKLENLVIIQMFK